MSINTHNQFLDNFNKGMLLYRKPPKNLLLNTAMDLLRRRRRNHMPHPAQIPKYTCDKYATSFGNREFN